MKTTLLQLKTALLLVLLTVSGEIFSQLTDWVNYTHGDVLAKMYNDGDYLWIATGGGLVKLNKATEEKTFYTRANANGGLPENQLRTLTKDNVGNIWVGTQYNGIGKFNETEGVSYFTWMQSCYSIKADSDDNIWFSGSYHLNKFDGTNLQQWTTSGSSLLNWWNLYDFTFDKDGILWIGGDPITFSKFTEEEGIQELNSHCSIVNNIEIDNDNNLWLAGEAGLVKYTGDDYIIFNTGNSTLPSD
ncbi:MAG: hypothetical protein LBP63_07455, partial [Prevotellaceae bacterium]|nr:hypothetical protein [Prevotellaceae bacterium]